MVGETDKTFKAYFKTENFKMIQDDYDVGISSQKISHFINRNKPIQYWVVLNQIANFKFMNKVRIILCQNIWVEKYRPKKISECILSEDIKKTFSEFLKQKEMPNLLLSGTQGTGKTTVVRALCEELGADYIIINGSDEGDRLIH